MRALILLALCPWAAADGDGTCAVAAKNSTPVLLQASATLHRLTEPSPQPSPQPTPSSDSGVWTGVMKATHYWDCSGQGCDATTLEPWDKSKYVSPPGYGPQDPSDFGGAKYGEKMWLTGAASDALTSIMGDDDGCCGYMDDQSARGGCGKCLLIQNPDTDHPDWTAVAMKKNRCPPWSTGCDSNQPHFDVAAPGFDNLQWSTANICGAKGTGFDNQQQSEAVGSWWKDCSSTAECAHLCEKLPAEFQKGCKLFASWGWTRGDPDRVSYKAVECPAAFSEHVGALFDENGVASGSAPAPQPRPACPQPKPAPSPMAKPTPTPRPSPAGCSACVAQADNCYKSGWTEPCFPVANKGDCESKWQAEWCGEAAQPSPNSPMPPGPGGICAAQWGQCGGKGWSGPTCCTGSTCKSQGEWYSQCVA